MNKSLMALPALLLLFVPCSAGCGKATLGTNFVEGVVKMDGAPLVGAVVKFAPKGGGGTYAQGQTDSTGRYTLTAMQGGGEGKGTTPGEYVVLVTKLESRKLDKPKTSRGGGPPITTETVNVLPKVYNDLKAAKFSATVGSGENKFDFELDSKAK